MHSATRRIGRYEINLFVDGLFEASTDVVTHTAGPEARRRALEAWGREALKVDVNCFALRGDDGIVLIDAGVGDAWGAKFGQARAALRAAGIEPEAVARVLLTHIHGDHALGLFAGEGAYFPNAEILVPERDFAYFSDAAAREATPEPRRGAFDIADKIARVYGGRLKRIPDGPVLPGIEAVALPGHTPGHTGYLISGDREGLLLWGDALHVGELQPRDPEIGLRFDLDPVTAARTRRATLERAADAGWIVAGGHISGFNQVARAGEGFALSLA